MTINFSCTACGRCCHDLRLPLSAREALQWIDRGGTVQIFCDAAPHPGDDPAAPPSDRQARCFPAFSGALPLLVHVLLVASFDGPCPNLLPTMYCGAYDLRPNVCRIYPAEIDPGRAILPANKLCPPEAWAAADAPVFLSDTMLLTDSETVAAITAFRDAGVADIRARMRLTQILGITVAALTNEGFAIWTPAPQPLRDALLWVCNDQGAAPADPVEWTFVSGSAATRQMIADAGAIVEQQAETDDRHYLSLAG